MQIGGVLSDEVGMRTDTLEIFSDYCKLGGKSVVTMVARCLTQKQLSHVSQQDSDTNRSTFQILVSCLSWSYFWWKSGLFSMTKSESLQIFSKIHPLFIKNVWNVSCWQVVVFIKHQMEHGQLSHGLYVLVWVAEGFKGEAQLLFQSSRHGLIWLVFFFFSAWYSNGNNLEFWCFRLKWICLIYHNNIFSSEVVYLTCSLVSYSNA